MSISRGGGSVRETRYVLILMCMCVCAAEVIWGACGVYDILYVADVVHVVWTHLGVRPLRERRA
jgi:hypothetical protein